MREDASNKWSESETSGRLCFLQGEHFLFFKRLKNADNASSFINQITIYKKSAAKAIEFLLMRVT